ncbi:MAG: fibronectin type III domain-containing protein [Altibacter sp.]|uniref:fibronectin type III domain-containing protein n=1 Tax=Altibacter sp. TaxID=2024823 RepID=UPI001DCACBE1|nr:fibronectin type III domain-containing protein [Altibacter sp.]MBZ0327000.1 fibronectin type III domain-containing protein [Altibacter sp.]
MKKLYLLMLVIGLVLVNACGSDDNGNGTDSESPSAPLNLIASNVSDTSLELSWTASTDNTAVTGYRLYEEISGNVTPLGGSTTTYMVTGLTPSTPYKFYVTAIDAAGNESSQSNTVEISTDEAPLEFLTNLSEMGIFTGDLVNLEPAENVQLYELNSTLFTDYAAKQRLIRFPEGQAMRYNNSDQFPVFPDNTLMAKTFFYYINDQDPGQGKQIIETRLLLKIEGAWQVGNYVWNASQTEATYRETGSEIPISYIDGNGDTQNVDYQIPSKADCIICHSNSNTIIPIGPKLRTMNFVPSYTNMNQLEYFKANGLLEGLGSASSISVLPDWTNDVLYTLEERARGYIDINCAHCHQPGGAVTNFNIDFQYETPYADTGIYPNRGEIEMRIQSTLPSYRMPQLGRTVVHEEAVAVLIAYLDTL